MDVPDDDEARCGNQNNNNNANAAARNNDQEESLLGKAVRSKEAAPLRCAQDMVKVNARVKSQDKTSVQDALF
jgi:hypothetical protein